MGFFRQCPKCAKRFHIKLENETMVHAETRTYRRLRTYQQVNFTQGGKSGASVTMPAVTAVEGPPVHVIIEDFQHKYECGHCRYQWTEHHVETVEGEYAKQNNGAGARVSRPLTAMLIVGLVATAAILGVASAVNWFGNSSLNCANSTGNGPQYMRFTIVMSPSGFNDSAHHNAPPLFTDPLTYRPPPWPIVNVAIGSNVIIHVLNNVTGQFAPAQGFAITHYLDQGVFLQPGGSCNLMFSASMAGDFQIWNNRVPDSFEQAQLNVS